MNKCRLCSRFCRTENGENVCTKYLILLDDNESYTYCPGPEIEASVKTPLLVLGIVVIMFFLMIVFL